MRTLVALVMLAAAAPDGPPLPVHVGGRAIHETGGAWRFGWPGVYFEARFRGTAATVAVDTRTELFRILVDGVARPERLGPATPRVTIAGLSPGDHLIRIEKLTESQSGGARLLGIWPARGGRPLPPPAERARRIEFIGDSYTVGYGNTSASRTCSPQEIHDTTDTQRAFGPLLAKRLGADYRVIAYSGYGMVRNYNGHNPAESLPMLYARALPGEATVAPADRWRPQLIVINLGTNDFSTPVHSGETWADEPALRRAYRERYVAFVRDLAGRQPQARFVLMGSDAFYGDVQAVATALNAKRPSLATTVHFGPLQATGCDSHPSLVDDTTMAGQLEAAIARLPGLWR